MTQGRHHTRRAFIQGATAGLAAPMVVGSSAFGANDRITTGIIGLGGPAGGGAGGTQLLAVCDVRGDKLKRYAGRKDVAKYNDPVGVDLMRAVKQAIDPSNIMNPGKVSPERTGD